ncbi:ABC-type antimicrobial peptide transport system, permease component [hydrothermal vent metagenome]|uniref:ABC-type antimicrobial peptide transport system, permease component n=1 Tax=hydrothermal vent metagenome TaxID=652676 RepID=A0A3B0RS85_9ZZZZ
MNDFSLIFGNLFRKKLRTILLIISILTAFLIFGVLGAFYKAWNAGTDMAAADRLITVNKINFTVSMPIAYLNKVRSIKGVKRATSASWFGGYYREPRNFVQSFAVDAQSYLEVYPELVFPDGQKQAFLNTRNCLAVGVDTALQYGWEVGQNIPLKSSIWQQGDGSDAWDFTICAIFDGDKEAIGANYAIFHYAYFNESLAFAKDMIGWMVLNSENASQNDAVSERVDALFANSMYETETSSESAFNKAFLAQLGNISLILTMVIGAAFVTILVIVGTTMVMAVTERTREIAVMKTLGFQTGRIFRMVLSEAMLLSFLGGLLGLGLSFVLVKVLAGLMASFMPGMALSGQIAGFAIGLMVLLGLATGVLPAIKAMHVKMIDALGKN